VESSHSTGVSSRDLELESFFEVQEVELEVPLMSSESYKLRVLSACKHFTGNLAIAVDLTGIISQEQFALAQSSGATSSRRRLWNTGATSHSYAKEINVTSDSVRNLQGASPTSTATAAPSSSPTSTSTSTRRPAVLADASLEIRSDNQGEIIAVITIDIVAPYLDGNSLDLAELIATSTQDMINSLISNSGVTHARFSMSAGTHATAGVDGSNERIWHLELSWVDLFNGENEDSGYLSNESSDGPFSTGPGGSGSGYQYNGRSLASTEIAGPRPGEWRLWILENQTTVFCGASKFGKVINGLWVDDLYSDAPDNITGPTFVMLQPLSSRLVPGSLAHSSNGVFFSLLFRDSITNQIPLFAPAEVIEKALKSLDAIGNIKVETGSFGSSNGGAFGEDTLDSRLRRSFRVTFSPFHGRSPHVGEQPILRAKFFGASTSHEIQSLKKNQRRNVQIEMEDGLRRISPSFENDALDPLISARRTRTAKAIGDQISLRVSYAKESAPSTLLNISILVAPRLPKAYFSITDNNKTMSHSMIVSEGVAYPLSGFSIKASALLLERVKVMITLRSGAGDFISSGFSNRSDSSVSSFLQSVPRVIDNISECPHDVVLKGTLQEVNVALATLSYFPSTGFSGYDSIEITAQLSPEDSWWLGNDKEASPVVRYVPITVTPTDSIPSILAPSGPLTLDFASSDSMTIVGVSVIDHDFPSDNILETFESCAPHSGSTRFFSRPHPSLSVTISASVGRIVLPDRLLKSSTARSSHTLTGSAPYVSESLRWLSYSPPHVSFTGDDEITLAVTDHVSGEIHVVTKSFSLIIRQAPRLMRISLSLGGLDPSFTVHEGEVFAITSSLSSRILLTCQGLSAIEDSASLACSTVEADSIIVEVKLKADYGKICTLKAPFQHESQCNGQFAQNMTLTQARCILSSGPTGERCSTSSATDELNYYGGRNMHGVDILSVDIRLIHFSSNLPNINETGSVSDVSSGASILVPIHVQPVASQFEVSKVPPSTESKDVNPIEGEAFSIPKFSLFDPDGNVSFVFGEPIHTTPHRLLRIELNCLTESPDVECILTVPRFLKRINTQTADDPVS
jgi:hypothetical protein